MARFRRILLWCLMLGAVLLGVSVLFLIAQAHRDPVGEPQYVALGSSFAAGAGLGPLQQGSPIICARSINGYPSRLSTMTGLELVDMSCGGAFTSHLEHGGQLFQEKQIRAINRDTQLVTITVGGNDLGYIGDLSQSAAQNSGSLYGRLVRWAWSGPRPPEARDYGKFNRELVATIRAIRVRSPSARVVVATYPTILPPTGTCAKLSLTTREVAMLRQVANRFAEATTTAARQSGAVPVDMNALGARDHACSPDPWTYGWTNAGIAPFHPTQAGADATAMAIVRALRAHQQE